MILSHLHRYLTFKIVCISLWNCTFGVAHKSLLVLLFCIYSLFLFAFLFGLHRAFNFSRKFNVQMIIKTFSIAVIWLVWTPTDTAETAWHFKGIQLCYHLSKSLKATAPFVHRVFGVRASKKREKNGRQRGREKENNIACFGENTHKTQISGFNQTDEQDVNGTAY